ncbi:MAG TPA: amidohydrolase family protein [Blastocatellia bacterium]|nr:amidohydrolase family protein [Blastocatellia bacterium]
MDIPLKKPRNTRLIRFKRLLLMGAGLFALVFGIGALPVAFLYFAGDTQNSATGPAMSEEAKQLQAKQKQVVAFINVNVVPMDSERVLTAQTVIVKDGLISALGPAAAIKVPPGALRVDGRGKYLMPGLADMHVHFEVFNEQVNPAMLRLFVANGVTTVLNLFGAPVFLQLKERVARGEILGPAIYTSGPFISNAPASTPTPEEVERAVIAQKKAGYDIIKIHGDFSREAYHKVFEVARREGMRVIGHLPRNLGIEAAFEEKQDAIAHAEEYLYAYFFFKPPTRPDTPDQAGRLRWIAGQPSRIPYVAEATAKAGIWVSPTLTVYHGIGLQLQDIDAMLKRPEMKYLPPALATRFAPANNTYIRRFKKETAPVFLAQADLLSKLVKGLHDQGVRLLAGTDTPVPTVVPGFSLHDELRELTAAGLSPYEALRTATTNAAEFLRTDKFGVVSVGKAADLILVEGNPLTDINNASRRAGVMVRGRWFSEEELRKMLEAMAASNSRAGNQ